MGDPQVNVSLLSHGHQWMTTRGTMTLETSIYPVGSRPPLQDAFVTQQADEVMTSPRRRRRSTLLQLRPELNDPNDHPK
jgi:hypothetical protein